MDLILSDFTLPAFDGVVSENSADIGFMRLPNISSEAARRVVCDSTRQLQMEIPQFPVG